MPSRIRIQNELVLRDRNVGIGSTLPASKLSITQSSNSQALDIGSQLRVDGSGVFNPSITIGSTVGVGVTQKLNIAAVSREGGLLEFENFYGNQFFSASNDQSGDLFNVYRYYQTGTAFIPIFQNRKLFGVSNVGDVFISNSVSGLGSFRLGNARAASTIFNEIHSNLVLRPGFSTSITQSVYIVPNIRDKGAISFESPVGTAQTNRGNQVFSISNNFDTTIFRINDLNRNPILEASATGNIGIGTATPIQKLQINSGSNIIVATSTGRIGIGTTNPSVNLDVVGESQFRSRVLFSQTSSPAGSNVIDAIPYSTGISTFATSGTSLVMTRQRNNADSQLFTIENNNNTLFRVNVVGFGVSTVTSINNTPRPIYPAIDVNSLGEVRIFDTETQKIITRGPGFSTTIPGDSDLFRIDSYVTPFIGSFPTVRPAVRIDKFGVIELSRNIISNNISVTGNVNYNNNLNVNGNIGIGTTTAITKLDVRGDVNITGVSTVGLGSTSSPSVNSTMSFELADNTTLRVRVRGSDGVVRTGIITLS